MRILTQRKETELASDFYRKEGQKIGFVPTMGALHQGHLELVRQASEENDVVFVSIFVNPEQFNNPEDFKLYPRKPEEDTKLLSDAGCHVLFLPDPDEVFNGPAKKDFNLNGLDQKLEGKYRPGHFQGVAAVVSSLLEIIRPEKAYFGKKDFQQVKVIEFMVKTLGLPVQIIPCDTIREPDGLAMSSRNLRLSAEARKESVEIFKALTYIKENRGKYPLSDLVSKAEEHISSMPHLKTEYLKVVDPESLEPLKDFIPGKEAVACIAVYADEVRLIDNISL